jgi:hypothetical protein
MDPLNDVKNEGGAVMPPVSDGTPLPGQTAPTDQGGKEGQDEEKVVPLAALHEERSKRQQLQAELEVLRQIAGDQVLFDINGKPVPNYPQHQQNQQHQQQQQVPENRATAEEMQRLWESDPQKAVRMEIMAAMSWRDHVEAQVDQQIAEAASHYEDFSEHEATVRKYVRALPPEQRGKKGAVDLAYFVVKGQNAGTAIERAKAEVLRKIQAGEMGQGIGAGTPPAPPAQKGKSLSEDQLKVASAMGLTPEQYMSAMVQK